MEGGILVLPGSDSSVLLLQLLLLVEERMIWQQKLRVDRKQPNFFGVLYNMKVIMGTCEMGGLAPFSSLIGNQDISGIISSVSVCLL